MFIDEAVISVRAGNGGNGCVSFRREKYIPKGGPAGGDGGNGGNVVFLADQNVNTLLDFSHKHHWNAPNGDPGRGKQMYGLAGEDLIIPVPPGTIIYNADSGEKLADLGPNDRAIVAKGGKGGRGNEAFKTSTNQTPKEAEPGEPGEAFKLRLELKLIADIGIVGLPNAGKSTLLAAISQARPKIANYPFTTLTPQLGIAQLDTLRRLVFADIPGLIEGASDGAGLGHEFLRHIERTRVLVHLIDASGTDIDGPSPAESYRIIRNELSRYSPLLAEKPELIVLSKMDLLDETEQHDRLASFRKALKLGHADRVLTISAATNQGTREMLDALWSMLRPTVNKWQPETAS